MNICNGVSLKDVPLKMFRQRNKIYYDNLCMLDIEVSTGFLKDGKIIQFDISKDPKYWEDLQDFSLMYLWNVCIDGYLFSGRALNDLLDFLEGLDDLLEGTFYIFIHNASYEFQFLRNILDGVTVFARKKRKPLKFNWRNIEFRCSYMLTRLSLDTWAKEKNLDVKKLTGKFDYTKIRTPLTYLTVLERDYGYNDVLVGVLGMQEYLDRYKHVKDIPITQTSCIRKEVIKVMKNDYRAHKKVAAMTDISLETYLFLVQCFMGGYTHANILYTKRTVENVWDFDISSSYPWCMLSEKYPCTPFVKTNNPIRYMSKPDKYCFAVKIEFTKIDSLFFNTYISESKCLEKENVVLDNGRIISADRVVMCLLDVDYYIIKRAYKIESEKIIDCYFALKDYLPDDYRRYIVTLFKHKTSLKNIPEMYNLYFKSKEELNGNYGMAVTKDITDEILFNGDWLKDNLTEEKYYEKVQKKTQNLSKLNMSYAQGVYVPAYARKNLWEIIFQLDDLNVYSDTDSLKIAPPHDGVMEVIESYNRSVDETQHMLADQLGISYEDFNPLDVKGIRHSIGIYERDTDIVRFKTLGCKRYICEYDMSQGHDYLKMTVSGVRKKAVKQLMSIDDFDDGLVFTAENAQKLLLKYRDNQESVVWNKGKYDEWLCNDRYGISSYNIPYHMTMKPEYIAKISRIMRGEITSLFREKGIK